MVGQCGYLYHKVIAERFVLDWPEERRALCYVLKLGHTVFSININFQTVGGFK